MFSKETLHRLISNGASISEILQAMAGDVIGEALACEARRFIEEHQEIMEDGKRRLVLNGHHSARVVLFPFGPVTVKAPRVFDRGGGDEPIVFESSLIPKYLTRSSDFDVLISWLYLKGLSVTDFQDVFEAVFGQPIHGLSAASVSKFLSGWEDELAAWQSRDMSGERYAYVWADGACFKIKDKKKEGAGHLMLMGAGEDGRKRLVGMGEGRAESSECWGELLAKLRRQGMEAPKLMIGDGGLGLWPALAKVFPGCGRQRCWARQLSDVRRRLPKESHAEVSRQIRDVYMSDDRREAKRKLLSLARGLEIKHGMAPETLTRWSGELTAFYDYPAEHWQHIRTTNPIESMFSTMMLRTRKTRGKLGRAMLGALLLKLAQAAAGNMKALPRADKIKLLLEGAVFKDGRLA